MAFAVASTDSAFPSVPAWIVVEDFVARSITDGSVPVLADTYSLFVTGLSAVRLPRSALSVSRIASVSGSMTEIVPGPRFIAYTRPLRGSMVRFLTLAPVSSVTTGPAMPFTILTMPRSGNAAYALPLRVLTTTPLGPSVTPTWALTTVARPRSAVRAMAGRREVVCRIISHRGAFRLGAKRYGETSPQ